MEINYFSKKTETLTIDIEVPEHSILPSITIAYLEGAQMQKEIADCYPIRFDLHKEDNVEKKTSMQL